MFNKLMKMVKRWLSRKPKFWPLGMLCIVVAGWLFTTFSLIDARHELRRQRGEFPVKRR